MIFTPNTLKPKAALLLYQGTIEESSYMELASFRSTGAGYELTDPKPLTKEGIMLLRQQLSAELDSKGKAHCLIPRRTLYLEPMSKYLWYRSSAPHQLNFSPHLPYKSDVYALPTLVFQYQLEQLSVWACAENIPEDESELYKAPFTNVSGGGVCLGSMPLKWRKFCELPYEEAFHYAEQAFFLSDFSHQNNWVEKVLMPFRKKKRYDMKVLTEKPTERVQILKDLY